jgi:hypothetical protein
MKPTGYWNPTIANSALWIFKPDSHSAWSELQDNFPRYAVAFARTAMKFKIRCHWLCGRRLGSRNYAAIFQPVHGIAVHNLLRNPTDTRRCSQHAGANVDFGDEGAVDWAFLGNLKQLRTLLLG